MTGRAALRTSIPRANWQMAAVPTAEARPPARHTSVRAESLPTIFSVYSPMSFWTLTDSISGSLSRKPGRVELPEVNRRSYDDRPACDGRDRACDLGSSLLFPDGETERHRAPDDQKAAQERDAAGNEPDYV